MPRKLSTEACVDVNHIYDKPGYYTCDCVDPSDACLEDEVCVREAACPTKDGQFMYLPQVSLKKGDIITLSNSESKVKQSFDNIGFIWIDQMKGMLGKRFPVLDIFKPQSSNTKIVALPSPDGSQNGKWYFSMDVVKKETYRESNDQQ